MTTSGKRARRRRHDPGRKRDPDRRRGGALGARPLPGETFHGHDPDLAASSAVCQISSTRCQARTRLYRDGRLELEGFPVADISDYLADSSVTIWLDLREPMMTVRSRGSRKYSAASAVIRDVAMNRRLRQRLMPGAWPWTSSMRDTK